MVLLAELPRHRGHRSNGRRICTVQKGARLVRGTGRGTNRKTILTKAKEGRKMPRVAGTSLGGTFERPFNARRLGYSTLALDQMAGMQPARRRAIDDGKVDDPVISVLKQSAGAATT
jgi:hypothetical protein